MTTPRTRVVVAAVLFALAGGSAGSAWRARGQTGGKRTAAETLPGRIPPSRVTASDRGATYQALESKALRLTTTFQDAIAQAERAIDGQLTTRVTDPAGNELATFRVHRVDAGHDSLEFSMPDRLTRHFARRETVRPTLDWANEQAYSLWRDRDALESAGLEWQDALVRPVGATARDIHRDILRTDTEWTGGFSASVTRKIGTHTSFSTGRKATGLVYVSAFRTHGTEVGSSQWWPQEQTFAWLFPGLTEGYVDASRLSESGGWPFAPDMGWMNTQNLAFFQFHSLVNAGGTVSERRGSWRDLLGDMLAITVHANEEGCDGLHWLDGSIFRPCCDSHDLCYAKNGCTWNTWWQWWSSWRCDSCNAFAVFCFGTGGASHVFTREP